jgi:glutamate-1-semialdehyde 2,1-aminomutase
MTHDEIGDYLRRHTPGGSQTASKAPGRAGPSGGGYPVALERGHGAWVEDEEGRTYLDFVASLAAVGLGHAHPVVTAAVERQLREGALLSLPKRLEGEASEMLAQVCAEALGDRALQVRWVKTGSEATEAAVRVARAATGRDLIATVGAGYHGWHSWFQAVKPQHPGVPEAMSGLIRGLPYGERQPWLDALSLSSYAAVLLEAAPITGDPNWEFVRWLIETAHKHGTLVIFDEVVWGWRLHPAGCAGYTYLRPDLSCFGKALGNGIPVAAVVGRKDLMRHAALVSGTYGGDALGLAAAVAVMRQHGEPHVRGTICSRMIGTGTTLQAWFNEVAAKHPELGCHMGGLPVHPVVRFDNPEARLLMSLFLQELADRCVLFHPGGINIMAAHTEAHVGIAVRAARSALRSIAEWHARGTLRENLRGEPYEAAFARAQS